MPNDIGKCVDAGSEYCPCYLAEVNECITCSQLQGKDICDCIWSGVCIYQEFFWVGGKRKETRGVSKANITKRIMLDKEVMLLKIKVPKTLVRELKHPGSYIFIRDPEKPHYFNVPMSIMDVDESKDEIDIAIQIIGAKTKSLLDCRDEILVKGPYWNGVLGMRELKSIKNEKVLVVARGMSLAPSVLTMKYLIHNKNKITFVMDPGKIGNVFIKDYVENLDIDRVELNLKTEEGLNKLRSLIYSKEFKLIYSAGSDNLHKLIQDEMVKADPKIKLAISNNSTICCGEGICGSCTCKTNSGDMVKMCKTQLRADEIVGRRELHG